MDWIKKHYDQFALALLALVLLALSIMLVLKAKAFGDGFSAATTTMITKDKVPPVSLELIEQAKETLKNPPQWGEAESQVQGTEKKRGSVFVSDLYVIGKDNTPKKPSGEAFYTDSLTNKPIPNLWFINARLPLLDPTVATQDPDKDGFTNEDEWRGTEFAAPGTKPTDPNNKDSHPAYHSKLFVRQFIRVPFRLLFNGHDFDPKKPDLAKAEFQINTIDLKQPSEFLKIGDSVKNTKFKLQKFESKFQKNANTGEDEDVSELTLINTETNQPVILVMNRVTDSPDYFMDFLYEWPNPPTVFRVKKLQEFILKPNVTEKYKLVDFKEEKPVIQTPDGKQIEIIPDPRVKK